MRSAKLVAYYLPQFHPIPENDAWWGEGFTEWTNTRRGQPLYPRHRQPQLPADLGFYDLRDEAARAAQEVLARRFGIDAFCFYYYWFGGKRLLERPLEAMLAGGSPHLPFCLCWANENWTRRWDGKDAEVLIAQRHSPEDDLEMIRDLIRHFRDPRYLRVDGKPLLIVYRIDHLPDPHATVRRWRDECRRAGVGEIHLCVVRRFETSPDAASGFDATVDFPPHGLIPAELTGAMRGLAADFKGRIFDYRDLVRDAVHRYRQVRGPLPNYPGVLPSWDNTARMGKRAHIFHGGSPLRYRAWLAEAIRVALDDARLAEPMVFINAWNEWAEGCHLEPDEEYGLAWLEATRAAREDAVRDDRLWRRYGMGLPVLAAGEERRLAGAPLEQIPSRMRKRYNDDTLPTRFALAVANLRRWVEARPRLRRAARPVAKLFGLAD